MIPGLLPDRFATRKVGLPRYQLPDNSFYYVVTPLFKESICVLIHPCSNMHLMIENLEEENF